MRKTGSMHLKLTVPLTLLAASIAWGILHSDETTERDSKLKAIPPHKVADYLHAVIAADRATYARDVVQRLSYDEAVMATDQDWKRLKCLPVPAQLLRRSAQSIALQGSEFSYALRSLWPINPQHGPQTAVEEEGLRFLQENPTQPFYREELLGGRHYFTAMYPDRAFLASCVECHNGDGRSPKRDFQSNDVIGAVVVRLPLEF